MKHSGFYIPGLDGLRALSILVVIAAHSGIPKAPGSLGVTIFFFISGYLITTLLLREQGKARRIDVPKFYARRYLRLFPEQAAFVVVAAVLSSFFLSPYRPLDAIAGLFYFTNYVKILSPPTSDWFGLGNLWSLAVEEHFYLTWPLLFVACKGSLRSLTIVLICVIAASIGIRIAAVLNGASYDYLRFASEARFESIAWGCLLAVATHQTNFTRFSAWFGLPTGAAGVVIVLLFTYLGIFDLAPQIHEVIVYTGQGIGLTLIFLHLYHGRASIVMPALEHPVMRRFGEMSYGMYLWHFVVIKLTLLVLPFQGLATSVAVFAAATLLSYGMAEASNAILLRPLRSLRTRMRPAPSLA